MGRQRSASRVATLLTVGSFTLSVVFAGAAWASSASADTGHGANQSAHGANQSGPYNATPSGPSGNGNGGGEATGKPCAGCVGNADNKNPIGQLPGGSDHNNGYECDGNNGIAKTNPAHTSCTQSDPSPTPPPAGNGGNSGGSTSGSGGSGSSGGTGGTTGGSGGTSNGGGSTTNGGGGTGGSDPGSRGEVAPVSFSRPSAPAQAAEALTDASTQVAAALPEIDPATPAVEAAFNAQPGSLPFTGFNTMPLFIAALAFLAIGAALQLHRPRPAVNTEG